MRLLYIHQYFAFPDIHSSTRSYDLSKSFVESGIDVTVITTTTKIKGLNEKKRWNYFLRDGIEFWVLTCNYNQKMNPIKRLKAFLIFMFFASVKIVKIKGDLVLATSTPITVALPAIIKKFISSTSFIFEVRDVWPENLIKMGFFKNRILIWFLSAFERFTYKHAYCVVPLSTDMEKSIKSRVGDIKTIVIPNISEVNRFQRNINSIDLGIDINLNKNKIILYAGALGKVNGIKYIADLASKSIEIDKSIIFIVIGVGNEKESIIQYCDKIDVLNKNIFFPDPVPKDSLPYLYSFCAMGSSFVIDNPALWANSANKFFDTLAAGKPILINYEGWQADLIRRENIGYVLPPVLSTSCVQSFVKYLDNVDLLQRQSLNSLKVAEEMFSLDILSGKYIALFKKFYNSKPLK